MFFFHIVKCKNKFLKNQTKKYIKVGSGTMQLVILKDLDLNTFFVFSAIPYLLKALDI